MKLKKLIFSLLAFLTIFGIFSVNSYAKSNLSLNNLHYDVILNSDGTANITEYWDIDISRTNTLFKTFEIDESKYSTITNVSIIETTDGLNKSFTQINEEMYHVTKDCFYSLVNSSNQFEIAWGVNEDSSSSTRTFEINYTVTDAIKNYADCSEFYWQFISTNSEIPADKITGTVTLPTDVTDIEDFRIWAHGPLNGNIAKTSNNTANFEITNFDSNTMLEVRVVTPTYVFPENLNTSAYENLEQILLQESNWAEEANRQRRANQQLDLLGKFFIIAFLVITNIGGIIITILLISKIKKYKKVLQEAPNILPSNPSKYYRDIPENVSPAQASILYYFKTGAFSLHISEIFSATLLDLCMKKYLSFEILADNNILVTLTPNMDKKLLPDDELLVYEMLEKVNTSKKFTMKEFEKYSQKHSTSYSKKFNDIEEKAKDGVIKSGYLNKNFVDTYNSYVGLTVGFLFLTIYSIIFMIFAIIPSIICTIYCSKISSRYNTLTQTGVDKKEQWIGLKNYMEDFSMMDKRELPELVLWEKYLVYATSFGISDTVIKQLKVAYPQITDINSNEYNYLYLMYYSGMRHNFVHSINNSVSTTYSYTNYSSGSGAGGGFSGGGGFGGGGGRNGRSLNFHTNCLLINIVCGIIILIYLRR